MAIYALRANGLSFIKFGRTTKPVHERVAELQTGCPLELELIAWCDGGKEAEAWAHWRLFKADAHVRGEWFKDCAEAQALLMEIKEKRLKAEGTPVSVLKVESMKRHRLWRSLDYAQRKSGGWRG